MIKLTRRPQPVSYGWENSGNPGEATMRARSNALSADDLRSKPLETLQREVLEGLDLIPEIPTFDWENAVILIPVKGQAAELVLNQIAGEDLFPESWRAEQITWAASDTVPDEYLIVPCDAKNNEQFAGIQREFQDLVKSGQVACEQQLEKEHTQTLEALQDRKKQLGL